MNVLHACTVISYNYGTVYLFVLYTKSTINMVHRKDAAQCVDEPSNLSHAIAQYT